MINNETYQAILNSIPHRLVFVDCDHVIRHLNRAAKAWFYTKRGHADLVGRSLFDCHKPESRDKILALVERLRQGEDAVFVKITKENEKASMMAVRDPEGKLIGYWERFESLAPVIPTHTEPRIWAASFDAERNAFRVAMENGRMFLLARPIPEDDHSEVLEVYIEGDGEVFTVIQASGNEFSVPWDVIEPMAGEKPQIADQTLTALKP